MLDGKLKLKSSKGEKMRIPWQVWVFIVATLVLTYLTRDILLPFVAGLAVAYLLDPLADKLEKLKFPRWLASATILALFFTLVTGIIFAILPVVQHQVSGFMTSLPIYLDNLVPIVDRFLVDFKGLFGSLSSSENLIAVAAEKGAGQAGAIITGFLSKGAAIFSLLGLLIISPVVAFFLLRDWDLIVERIDHWLPKQEAPVIRRLAKQIDAALAGFVRGQTLSAISMAILYGIGWSLAGLEFALVLGLLAGLLAYVPFVGALFAAFIAMLVGLGQFGLDFMPLMQIFGVFVVVQIIEAAFLTPHLIGTRVGLHPVWVLFAIFAGGEVMGFVGVLIALPMAAAIGVLARYAIETYLDSDIHKGKVEE
jgi:predicted PurR-regulated permease PerM